MTTDDKTGFVARLAESNAPAATLVVRLMVGGVFLSEGIQKFLIPELRGAGRFAKIGLPSPEIVHDDYYGFHEAAADLVGLVA